MANSTTNGATTHPKMIDLDQSRSIDLEALRLEFADKFKSYTPKARAPSTSMASGTSHSKNKKYKLIIDPPLLNSSCPWATDLEQIQALYDCPYTGAVTTRTSLLEGFNHDPSVHQHIFFQTGKSANSNLVSKDIVDPTNPKSTATGSQQPQSNSISSLNTYGYSPHTLSEYLGLINEIVGQRHLGTSTYYKKPFILSVTGTPDEIAMSYALLANAAEMDEDLRLCMEVNLSCPNIKGKPPPAYDEESLKEYLEAIRDSKATYRGRMGSEASVPRVGVKLPPYTWSGQFTALLSALISPAAVSSEPSDSGSCCLDFLTATNTLGTSLVMTALTETASGTLPMPVLASESGTGIGGLAGSAIHALSLGNVATLRALLDSRPETANILIIGVGGVEDRDGFDRMRGVGAEAVAVASALGRYGVGIFENILKPTHDEAKLSS